MENTTRTVLVVEDERPLAEAISLKLKKNGFEVITARAVNQALEYLRTIPTIDVIWLDHYLIGKESGLDLVTTLKSSEGKWKSIPIFVVSNTAGPDKVKSYIQLGVTKYFVKAENKLDEIIGEIKQILDHGNEVG